MTDELNVTAGVELFQAAKECGIRALLGAKVPVTVERKVYSVTLLARSRSGYANLNRIIAHALERESRDLPLPVLLAETGDLVLLTGDRRGWSPSCWPSGGCPCSKRLSSDSKVPSRSASSSSSATTTTAGTAAAPGSSGASPTAAACRSLPHRRSATPEPSSIGSATP